MLGQFVEHISGGSDGVGTEIEAQTGLFGSGNQAIGCGLVAGDVHIASLHLVLRLDAVCGGHAGVHVVAIVVAGLHHLDVVFGDGGLFGEFLTQEVGHQVKVAVEEPANQSECEHVAALQYRLVVHSAVGQTILDHCRERTSHHPIGVDAHLAEIVVGLESCSFKVFGSETVGVDDDGGLRLCKLVLCLECGRIHAHQHVTLITGGINPALADVYLKA